MTCSACGDKPQKAACGFPKAIVEIDNPEKIILLRKVLVPASMGDESTFPPTIGKYHNVLLEYETSGGIYLYSSDGIPTKLSSDVTELQAQLNALRVRIGEEEVARADADTALSGRITSLDNSLATVAKTGSYNDLSNKPTIGNGTLTIKKNGSNVGTFTANATTNKAIDISVPTKTSDLTNDGSDGTSTYVEADELSTVATTGSYNDLTNKPTIPTVNNATLTIQKNGTNVQTFTANSSTNKTANITVPTAVSELANDAGYATTTQLNDGLATKQNTLTAGDNIQINGNTISATDTTYTAGNAIDITNGEISADIHPADFFTAEGVVSDCGSDLSLDGTMVSALESIELKGNTFQQTYSGAQLLTKNGMATPYTDSDYWSLTAGASNTDLGDGWGRWVHTGTTTWVNIMPQMSAAISGGTYKTSTVYTILLEWKNVSNFERVTISQPGNAQDPFDGEETTVGISLSQTSGTSKIALTTKSTLTDSMRAVRMFFTKHTSSSDANIDIRVTIVEGDYSSSDLQWQPYVGGIASPNPEYPQDVQVVTGEQTVTVTGKNLSPYPYNSGDSREIKGITFTAASDGSVTINGTNDGTGNSAYYIYNNTSSPLQLEAGTYYFIPPSNTNVDYVMYDGTTYLDFNSGNNYSWTFPSAKSIRQFYIQVPRGNTTVFDNLKVYPMLTTLPNQTEADYEPYQSQSYTINLGSTELCKIGDYQDYIYKSGDDWYLHKDCGEITFDSSTDWAKHSTTQGNVFTLASTGLVGYAYNSGQIAPALMDTDRVIELGSMADNAYGVFGITNAGHLRVFRGDYDSSYTATVFKSEMTGHYVYGALAQPIDTQITDTILVAQLNALAEAKSYNDQTNIIITTAGENLPATLCVEAYRKSLSGIIEAIDNACTCGERATHLVLSNPTTATWSETGGIAIPLSDGSAVVMGTSVSTDVVFTKDDGTTMTVGDLYTALTNGKSFEIDLPFGEINSACARDSAAIVATVENVKLDGSSKQTLDQTSQGNLSEMYTSSVPVVAHLSAPWGGMLLDERFGVEHLTIDDNGTMTSSYRFVVNTYENFQPPN